jgi:serine/threonine protein kinase
MDLNALEGVMIDNPSKLGKFIIEAELGKGAMGIVYKAIDPYINRTVALKTVSNEQLCNQAIATNQTDTIAMRFKREAQAAGLLNHPNIVSVYEYGEDKGTAFIAMEFVKGRSLKVIFDRNERFDMNAIIKIMLQILGALAYSHKHSIVHRDIKPANIIIMSDGQVKIADFGIAHVESSDLTQMGTVLGTPNYMSPEQFMGQKVDGRSDLFSAGIIFYQFVTGENPFDGRSMATVMHKVLNLEPLDPFNLNFQVSTGLNRVIKQAISKRPEDRFQTAEAFCQAITEAYAAKSADPKNQLSESSNDACKTVILSEQIMQKNERTACDFTHMAFNPFKTFLVAPPESELVMSTHCSCSSLFNRALSSTQDALKKLIVLPSPFKSAITCGVIAALATALMFSIYRFMGNKSTTISKIQESLSMVQKPPAPPDTAETTEIVMGYANVLSMLTSLGLNSSPADLSLWTDRNQFLIGDRIHYYFKADKGYHVSIIGLTTDGKAVQLFPNRYQNNPMVHAGQTYVIVDDSAETALEVSGPAGQEEVIAFVSEQPFELFPTDFTRQPFIELSTNSSELKNVSDLIQIAQQLNISQKRIRYQIIGR